MLGGWLPAWRRPVTYSEVATGPASDDDQSTDDEEKLTLTVSRRWGSTQLLLTISTGILLLSFVFFFQQTTARVTDARCIRRMSAPSPVLEAVELEWQTFHDIFQPDVYSGYPDEASEKAWASLWDFGAFSVSLDMLAGLNKTSTDRDFRLVNVDGVDGVGGLLEGAHQIHCLNLVRQFIYRDFWDYSGIQSFSGGEKVRRHHVDHCIETLRIVMQCNSDVTPYLLRRSETDGSRMVGKTYPHKCRVYPKLVDWVNSHSVFDTVE